LKAYGLAQYISIDFGMLKRIDYYTGIIFRGITDDLGCPILAGGRYDTLIESFGRDACATGFAIGLKRVLIALERQGKLREIPRLDAVIGGFDRGAVFKVAEALRSEGKMVEQVICPDTEDMDEQGLIDYARGKAKSAIFVYGEQDYERFDVEVGQ
ncbi:MAG: ATP phosphoribosyltransferase regulatory subunit, partial [Christensenellales bacterium]|jgi:ATP phosphoribosyltransferase regulatory subunit